MDVSSTETRLAATVHIHIELRSAFSGALHELFQMPHSHELRSLPRSFVAIMSVLCGRNALHGFIVAELPRPGLPRECGTEVMPEVERLDMARYRANGLQAWIRR